MEVLLKVSLLVIFKSITYILLVYCDCSHIYYVSFIINAFFNSKIWYHLLFTMQYNYCLRLQRSFKRIFIQVCSRHEHWSDQLILWHLESHDWSDHMLDNSWVAGDMQVHFRYVYCHSISLTFSHIEYRLAYIIFKVSKYIVASGDTIHNITQLYMLPGIHSQNTWYTFIF